MNKAAYKADEDILQSAGTSFLLKAVHGELNLNRLAELALFSKGLDEDGEWVGFDEAKRIYNVTLDEIAMLRQE